MDVITLIPIMLLAIWILYLPCSLVITGIVKGITHTINNEHALAKKCIKRGTLGLCILASMMICGIMWLLGIV